MNTHDSCVCGDVGCGLCLPAKPVRRSFDVRTLDPEAPYERDRSYVGTTDADIARVEAMRILAVERSIDFDPNEKERERQANDRATWAFEALIASCNGDYDRALDAWEECARRRSEHAEVCAEEVRRHGFCRHCEEGA